MNGLLGNSLPIWGPIFVDLMGGFVGNLSNLYVGYSIRVGADLLSIMGPSLILGLDLTNFFKFTKIGIGFFSVSAKKFILGTKKYYTSISQSHGNRSM